MNPTLQTFPTPQAASEALAALLAERLSAGGRAVLSGGNTPLAAYRLWGQRDILWNRVQLMASDERCLPADHPERNDNSIPAAIGPRRYTYHRFPAERGPEAAASAMEPVVAGLLPFDLVVLGLGEDGHTASLFPGQPLETSALVVPVHNAPKPPPERVSLSVRALSQTQLVVYFVTGEGKRGALKRFLGGENLPPQHIRAPEVWVLCDRAAYPAQ
ncbi:6-phosphogluconolactonase [Meiothermus granaticius]|uniref:6-phosphogluconolactonase n=1 Tax=Meiothermus granaticius NBRC 107808 TaxID=1227551 RepID=A0A399FBX2_9DEIN|nr:6-phosphogluconolactonase [Meiothermus granaticius]RIH92442.1 6-phosphogluconolactonase [Meiothermus granaticius NBRC 107808]GEM87140.1 6-phosphogluconolactonase [Meiothermus granaticius NBRC 107808]